MGCTGLQEFKGIMLQGQIPIRTLHITWVCFMGSLWTTCSYLASKEQPRNKGSAPHYNYFALGFYRCHVFARRGVEPAPTVRRQLLPLPTPLPPPSLRDESTLGSKTTNPTGDHVTDKILALNCSLHSSYILPWLLLLIICLVRISN